MTNDTHTTYMLKGRAMFAPVKRLITRSIAFFRTNFTDWGSCTTGKPSGSSCAAQATSRSGRYVQEASVHFQ